MQALTFCGRRRSSDGVYLAHFFSNHAFSQRPGSLRGQSVGASPRGCVEARLFCVRNGSAGPDTEDWKMFPLPKFDANCLNLVDTALFVNKIDFSAAKVWGILNASAYRFLLLWAAVTVISAQPSISDAKELVPVSKSESLQTLKEKEERLLPLPKFFPPLQEFSLPKYEKFILPNGLRVFLLEDHEFGLVGGQLLVRGGSKSEPAKKVGLALMTSVVQRSGGSLAHPADVLDVDLETLAARIESSSSVSNMRVGFRCLSEDFSNVFSLFSEVVLEPAMPEKKLDLIRAQLLGAIARRQDDPAGIVSREFQKLVYGKASAYARVPEIETVKAVKREDLLAFHQQLFCPDAGALGIWGDFDASIVKKLVQEQFGGWTSNMTRDGDSSQELNSSKSFETTIEKGLSSSEPFLYIVDIPGLTQGYVRMGELGTTFSDPDIFSLDVLNGLLNGFGGLLFDEVRSREGLAYSVFAGWSPAVEHRGTFVAGGETRLESIPNFVQAVKKVLEEVTENAPKADRLDQAKAAALNSFVFNFANSTSQLARVMSYELFGIDQNFLFQYKKGVEEVTSDQILQAAKRHLHPSSQPILVVTDVKKLEPWLLSLDTPVLPLPLK